MQDLTRVLEAQPPERDVLPGWPGGPQTPQRATGGMMQSPRGISGRTHSTGHGKGESHGQFFFWALHPGISCILTGGWIVTHTVGLDRQQLLVVEGSRCRESDSQVSCHRNWVHLVSLAGQTPLRQCHVRATTTTGASSGRQGWFARWRRRHMWCPPPEGMTPALVMATRAAERQVCLVHGSAPLRSECGCTKLHGDRGFGQEPSRTWWTQSWRTGLRVRWPRC